MSLTSFASVLFEARVSILNDFAKPINMNKFTGYFSVSLHCFFRTSYFFSLKNVGTSFLTSDPPYAGDRYDTSPPVEHPNNTLLCFCFICRISRSLCNLMFWFLEWYFCVGLVKFYFNQMDYNILNHYVATKLTPAIVYTQHFSRILIFKI